jgi:hypothetical protein
MHIMIGKCWKPPFVVGQRRNGDTIETSSRFDDNLKKSMRTLTVAFYFMGGEAISNTDILNPVERHLVTDNNVGRHIA